MKMQAELGESSCIFQCTIAFSFYMFMQKIISCSEWNGMEWNECEDSMYDLAGNR